MAPRSGGGAPAAAHAEPILPRAYNLSLLRLRMRLALMTMAILPTILAMALTHSTLSAHSVTDHLRVHEQAAAAGRTLDSQLERIAATALVLAANPAIVDAAADPSAAVKHARAVLAVPPVAIQRVRVFDPAGNEISVLASGSPRTGSAPAPSVTLTAADVRRVLDLAVGHLDMRVAGRTGPDSLVIATPLVGQGARRTGVLAVEVALPGLVSATRDRLEITGDLLLVDHAAALLLDASGPADANPAGPAAAEVMIAVAGSKDGAGHLTLDDGWLASAVPLGDRFAAWRVVLVDRVAQPELPLGLLGLLAALSALLVGITVWMSRQVLRPAQELAVSREQLLRLYEAARTDALHDGLTGLGNHRAFQEQLAQQIDVQQRHQVPFALVLIDLDDLKLVNDTEGHAAGDQVMREMARLIRENSRSADRAFRIGGDEFAILMPYATAEDALTVGRRLLVRAMENSERSIRFSGGISACPDLATSRDQLFAQADAALYWCKRHGRASLDVFDPARDRSSSSDAAGDRAARIGQVVSESLLRAVYQPVVDLRSGRVIAYEGLTRPLPESGFSDPGSLFAAAEAVGRTVELDHACFATVVALSDGLAPDQKLSVNLSPRTVEAPQFTVEWLTNVLRHYGMDPRRLVIELTERQIIEDMPRLQRNLRELQRAGVQVAVDDVGAGNAGLRLLSQFRFDIVKVDLSLVQDGSRRDTSRAVLTSLAELSGRWNAYVVAEGLETVQQLRVVREIGLDGGQGYLLGRPTEKPSLGSVDVSFIEAGGVVLEVPAGGLRPDMSPAPPRVTQPGPA